MLKSYDHLMLYVTNFDSAMQWYQDVLGFETLFGGGGYARLRHPKADCTIALHGCDDDSLVGGGPVPYFTVDDLDGAVATLRDKGVECAEPRAEGGGPRFSSFKDCCGNTLGFQESA